jgi:hypothetical protein
MILIKIVTIILNYGIAILTFVLVLVTIYYAWQTRILAEDSSRNVEILKNNLTEQHLIKEMEKLIKPLYKNRNEFEDLEFVHSSYSYNAKKFWKNIEADMYLGPKDLRGLIEKYLKINYEWWNKYEKIKQDIECFDLIKEKDNIILPGVVGYTQIFSDINEKTKHLPQSRFRNEQLGELDKLINKLNPECKIRNYLEEFGMCLAG